MRGIYVICVDINQVCDWEWSSVNRQVKSSGCGKHESRIFTKMLIDYTVVNSLNCKE